MLLNHRIKEQLVKKIFWISMHFLVILPVFLAKWFIACLAIPLEAFLRHKNRDFTSRLNVT